MEKEVPIKTGVALLLVAIIIAVLLTFGILNFIQTPRVSEPGSKESASSGEISLTLVKQPKIKDDETGSISLNLLPPGEK